MSENNNSRLIRVQVRDSAEAISNMRPPTSDVAIAPLSAQGISVLKPSNVPSQSESNGNSEQSKNNKKL